MSIWPLCTGSKVPGYTATRRAGGCVTALRGCSLSRRTASTSLSAWLHRRSLGGFYLDAGPVVYRCRADEVWLPCVDSTVLGNPAPTGSRAAAIRRGSLWPPSPFGGDTRERQREGPPGPERLLSGAEGLGVGAYASRRAGRRSQRAPWPGRPRNGGVLAGRVAEGMALVFGVAATCAGRLGSGISRCGHGRGRSFTPRSRWIFCHAGRSSGVSSVIASPSRSIRPARPPRCGKRSPPPRSSPLLPSPTALTSTPRPP